MTANARCSRRKVPSVAGYNRLTTLSREVSIGENRRISPLLHQSCQGIIRVSPVESSRPLIAAFALCIDPVVARDRNFSICRALSAAKDHQSHIAILLSIFGKNIASYRVVYESVLWRRGGTPKKNGNFVITSLFLNILTPNFNHLQSIRH